MIATNLISLASPATSKLVGETIVAVELTRMMLPNIMYLMFGSQLHFFDFSIFSTFFQHQSPSALCANVYLNYENLWFACFTDYFMNTSVTQ